MIGTTITWLHLSDLHTCRPHTGWDAHRVLDTLEKDLSLMEGTHGLRPDFIVFTGDAAFGELGPRGGQSIAEQFVDAEVFFTRVRNVFTVPVPKDRFFIVPGNHDVNRLAVSDPETQWLAVQSTLTPVTSMIQKGDLQWGRFADRLADYRSFLEREGYPHLLTDAKRLIFSRVLDISGTSIGIAGFNSAWSCCRDKEKGALWLAGGWQCAELHRAVKDAPITLALMHHPLNWFVPQEDPKISRVIERDFTFFLHGHEHQGWVHESADGHVRIAASACYETSDDDNGYNFVRIDTSTGNGEVFLRKYDSLGGGWIPRIIHGKTDRDGVWHLRSVRVIQSKSRHEQIPAPDNRTWAIVFTIGAPLSQLHVSALFDALRTSLGADVSTLEITRVWKGSTHVMVEGDNSTLQLIVDKLTRDPDARDRFAMMAGLTRVTWELGHDRGALEVGRPEGEQGVTTDVDLSGRSLTELPDGLRRVARIQRLDLSNNQLTALPEWIGDFKELLQFDLSRNQLRRLPDAVGGMIRLKTLVLRGNDLAALPEALSALDELEVLDVSENKLSALPGWLGRLRQLRELYVAGNLLSELPRSLMELVKLEVLSISTNQLRNLPEWLGSLRKLQSLAVAGNRVSRLPTTIMELPQLKHLDLRANSIGDLPNSVGKLSGLQSIELDRNPLGPDLAAAYHEGQEVVLRFLRARAKAFVVLHEAKLILVGEGEVGKSSLLSALRGDVWEEGRSTTHGIEIKPVKVSDPDSGMEITLNGWDFGGQRVYRPTHQLFFSAPAVYLVVWKPREGPQQGFVREWIKLIKHRGPDAKILVVATHGGPKDRQPDIDRQEIWDLFGKETVLDFFHIDSQPPKKDKKTGQRTGECRGIKELKDAIAQVAASLPEMGRTFPKQWQEVREALRNSEEAYIPLDQVLAICKEHNVEAEDARLLLRICHRVGDLIYYEHDPALRDIVVLKPDWLATAISYVLDDQETRDVRHGLVSFERLGLLWNDPARPKESRYDPNLHPLFVRLMERFDLSYKVAVPSEPEDALGFWERAKFEVAAGRKAAQDVRYTSLIAQLVPDVRPSSLPAWPGTPAVGDEQQVQVCRIVEATNNQSATAEGLFYQLIVRLHKYSLGRANFHDSVHWQRGLVLEDTYGARALLEHIDNDIRITVRSPYPEHFLSALTLEVKWLVETFWSGLRCEVTVPCLAVRASGERCNGLLEVEKLLANKKRGRPEQPCPVCNEWQSIGQLLRNAPAARPNPLEELLANAAETRRVLNEVRRHLCNQQVQIIGRFDRLDAASKEVVSKVESAYTGIVRTLLDEAKEGPRLFSFEPVEPGFWDKPKWVSTKYRFTLWCEHSRLPLLALNGKGDRRGVYEVAVPREWVVKSAPFLKVMSTTLRLVLPVASSALKVAIDETTYKGIEDQLDLGEKCVAGVLRSAGVAGEWLGTDSEPGTEPSAAREVRRAILRQLQVWLKEQDPGFGGLVRVQNKRHEFLWVHPRFEKEY